MMFGADGINDMSKSGTQMSELKIYNDIVELFKEILLSRI